MKQTATSHPKTLAALNKYIQHEIKSTLLVVKGEGYFYIASDDEETALQLAKLYQTSIYVYRVSDLSFERWYETISALLNESNTPKAAPSTPVNDKQEQTETVEGLTEKDINTIILALSVANTRYNTEHNGNIFMDFAFPNIEAQNEFAATFETVENKLRQQAPTLYRDNAQLKEALQAYVNSMLTPDHVEKWYKKYKDDETANRVLVNAIAALNQSK